MRLQRIHALRGASASFLVFSIVIGGCRAAGENVAGPSTPEAVRSVLDCQLSQSECDRLRGGIDHLLGHGNEQCQAHGNLALMRFEAEGYGFRQGTLAPQLRMYVVMDENTAYPSGAGPSDNNTYVNSGAFTDEFGAREDWKIGSDIAHEEVHQAGQDDANHNTGLANAASVNCY